MSHFLYSRIICDARTRRDAVHVFDRIARTLGLDAEMTVCEPFGENPDRFYDIVFTAPLPSPPPASPMRYFESLLERIDGTWQHKYLAYHQGQNSVLDSYAEPKNGIAWMSLELHPAIRLRECRKRCRLETIALPALAPTQDRRPVGQHRLRSVIAKPRN